VVVTAEGRSAPEQAIEDWGRHWSSHDFDHLPLLFTDDVVYERVTMGLVHRGKGELRAFGEGLIAAFPDVTFELTSRHATGHRGGAEWVMRGTHRGDMPGLPATGKAVEVRGASILKSARCPFGGGVDPFVFSLRCSPS
jgi:steroid delta-isomerase-like uncharacterized protein